MKHMQHKPAHWALAALLAAASAGAAAQAVPTGGYALVAGGRSDLNQDCTGLQQCKDTGTALKFVAGYRFGGGLGAELLVLDFGKATATVTVSGVTVAAEAKARAIGGGASVVLPLAPKLTATVRLGVAQVKLQASARRGSIAVSQSESSTQVYAGAAVAYHFTDNLSVEAGFDSTNGKFDGDKGRLTALTAGLGLRF